MSAMEILNWSRYQGWFYLFPYCCLSKIFPTVLSIPVTHETYQAPIKDPNKKYFSKICFKSKKCKKF